MEQNLSFIQTTKPMSTCYSNPPQLDQNQEILVKESSNVTPKRNPSRNLIRESSMPIFEVGKDEEDDIEDDESEFKMGRLIRQASLDSSRSCAPPQITKVKLTGSSSLPRYPLQKTETNQEKIMNMKERNRSKKPMKMGKNTPTIPGGWVDKGSSEDMKAQIKFWARAVAFNVHQEC